MLVIIVSATFYAVVDFHASRIMKSIRNLIAEEATVIRDGERRTVPSVDIVVGDIVLLTLVNFILLVLFIIILIQILRAIVSLLIFVSSKHLRICVSIGLFSPVKGSFFFFFFGAESYLSTK